jgi:hypothetical protein
MAGTDDVTPVDMPSKALYNFSDKLRILRRAQDEAASLNRLGILTLE